MKANQRGCLPFLLLPMFLSAYVALAQGIETAVAASEIPVNWLNYTRPLPTQALQQLASRGVTFQSQCIHDLSRAPFGAPGAQVWFTRYSSDVMASIDGHKALGWTGGSIFVDGKEHKEISGRSYDGVAQAYSNIDASSRITLYQAWAQQSAFGDKLRVKAGRIDANTDFDVVATAADFLNSSMGFSPTIMDFPSYPSPHLGADFSASAGKGFNVSAGEFGTARGRMLIAETAHPWTKPDAGRAALGAWRLHEPILRFDGEQSSGTGGLYGVLEQTLWHRPLTRESEKTRSLAAFAQIGTGNGHENPLTLHLGSGTELTAPFQRRSTDSVGVATTWVRFTNEANAGYTAHSELAVEFYYKANLSRTLSLITDVQYFRRAGGMWVNPDSLIATPRLVMSF
jgi:porin